MWVGEARWGKRTLNSLPTPNTVKMVVLLSLKTNWGWEVLGSSHPHLQSTKQKVFYNQGCQERSTRSQVRRRNDHVGTYTTSRGHRRGGGCHKLEILPIEWEILATCLALQPWDLTLGRWSPLIWFENQWDYRGYEKLRLYRWRVCTHTSTPGT